MRRNTILVNLCRWEEEELVSKLHSSWVLVGAKVIFTRGTMLCSQIMSELICSDVSNICVLWVSAISLCWAFFSSYHGWMKGCCLFMLLKTSEECNFYLDFVTMKIETLLAFFLIVVIRRNGYEVREMFHTWSGSLLPRNHLLCCLWNTVLRLFNSIVVFYRFVFQVTPCSSW